MHLQIINFGFVYTLWLLVAPNIMWLPCTLNPARWNLLQPGIISWMRLLIHPGRILPHCAIIQYQAKQGQPWTDERARLSADNPLSKIDDQCARSYRTTDKTGNVKGNNDTCTPWCPPVVRITNGQCMPNTSQIKFWPYGTDSIVCE